VGGSLELSRLLDLAAQRTQVRLEYVPSQISGTVTIRGDASDSDLWQIANARLADTALTTVRGTGMSHFRVVKLEASLASVTPLEVVRSTEPNADDPSGAPKIAWPEGPRPGYAAVIVATKNRVAKDLLEPVKSLLSKAGSVTVVAGTEDKLLIADLTSKLEQALALFPLVDVPSESAVFEEIPLKNLSASQMVTAAKELVAKRDAVAGVSGGGVGRSQGDIVASPGGRSVLVVAPKPMLGFWRDLIARLDGQVAMETKEFVPRVFSVKEVAALASDLLKGKGDDQARIVPDELTGTLIVTATPDQHERIAALMTRLDAVPAGTSARLRSFPIRNRPVRDVAASLNELLGGGEIEFSSVSPSRDSSGIPAAVNPAIPDGDSTGRGSVTNSRRGEAASPRRTPVDTGASSARPQLTMTIDEGLNTLIVVGEPRLLEQVEQLLKTLDVRQPQVMVEVTLVSLTEGQSMALSIELQKFGSLGGNAVQLASLFGSPTAGTPPQLTGAPGTGFTGAVLNPGDFNAVIKALERVNAGRSSSTPRVLVANNQEASFKSVAQQPTSNTSTNTTSTTITSFGGFQDAGTTIRVKPQIADGDRLTLDYSIELSSFTGQPTGGLPSARQQNSVASVAQIPDGFTVIVGGFELKTESEDETRVPLLGEVPLVGELFKSRTKTNDRTRFYAFIRANVMRGSAFEELKYVSSKDSAASKIDDGWPEVEPLLVK
jgi:type II secretory pathway component GspD/PulD (secretin)